MSGKMFYGKSADGSDAKEFEGIYVNPENPNEWFNEAYRLTRNIPKQKEWVCKGRHQYREVKEQDGSLIKVRWVCQCGKSL